MDDELLTAEEVAKILKVDSTSVRRWVVNGTLPAVRLPHKGLRTSYRIRRSTITDMLNGKDVSRAVGPSHDVLSKVR